MGTHPIFESDFDCLTVRKGKMGGRRKGKDPNHGNSTMVKMRGSWFRQRNKNF